jgi:hypothetical protein
MTDTARIIDFPLPPCDSVQRASLLAITAEGYLLVRLLDGREWECDMLQGVIAPGQILAPMDRVLVLPPSAGERACVLGRIGPYRPPEPQPRLTLEATEVLTLKCGDATLDLRADGKAVLKGEDVLIRATGLQRIKAGSVSIN